MQVFISWIVKNMLYFDFELENLSCPTLQYPESLIAGSDTSIGASFQEERKEGAGKGE